MQPRAGDANDSDNSGATANSTSACSNAINRLILRLLAK